MPASSETPHLHGRYLPLNRCQSNTTLPFYVRIHPLSEQSRRLAEGFYHYFKWRRRDLLFRSIRANVCFDKQFCAYSFKRSFFGALWQSNHLLSFVLSKSFQVLMPFLCEGVTDRIQRTQWFNLLTNLLSKHVCFTIIPALVFYTMRDYNKQSATESSAKTSFRGTGKLQIKDFYF